MYACTIYSGVERWRLSACTLVVVVDVMIFERMDEGQFPTNELRQPHNRRVLPWVRYNHHWDVKRWVKDSSLDVTGPQRRARGPNETIGANCWKRITISEFGWTALETDTRILERDRNICGKMLERNLTVYTHNRNKTNGQKITGWRFFHTTDRSIELKQCIHVVSTCKISFFLNVFFSILIVFYIFVTVHNKLNFLNIFLNICTVNIYYWNIKQPSKMVYTAR